MRALVIGGLVALTGCNGAQAVKERIQTVSVPVTVPCVDGARPEPVARLSDEHTTDAWNALSVRQKAALVSAKGMARQSYGDALTAATAGCK